MLAIQAYVEQVSLEDFGLEFQHQALWNHRLRTTGGTFHPKDFHLAFNPKVYAAISLVEFRKIVRHELCHYHLYRQNKGYRHRDQDFKLLLKQVDGSRFTPQIAPKTYRIYLCRKCGHEIWRLKRIDTKKYRCGQCFGKLVFSEIQKK